jgi:hypothetical protein
MTMIDSSQSIVTQAKLQQSFRLYVILAAFIIGMFAIVAVLATDSNKDDGLLILGSMFLLLAAFFVALIRYAADKVELQLTTTGVIETKSSSGQSRELYFDDFKQFAFMSDGRANYWIRIRLKSGGPMIRYSPMGIRDKFRKPFIEFGHIMRRAVDAFNSQQTVERSAEAPTLTRDTVFSPAIHAIQSSGPKSSATTDKPIQTGLIKSEKALNWTLMITRIIYLGIFLIFGLTSIFTSDHPGQTLLYVLLGGVVLFGIYWFVKKNKKKQ